MDQPGIALNYQCQAGKTKDARIAELETRIAALEAMLRAAGYSEMQIKAGTPYVEMMGS